MRVSKNLSLLRRFFNLLNVDSEFKMCKDFLSKVFLSHSFFNDKSFLQNLCFLLNLFGTKRCIKKLILLLSVMMFSLSSSLNLNI